MAIVTILPSGLRVEIEPGQNMLRAVSKEKLCWPQTCGGKAQCTTCVYTVLSGDENLRPPGRLEQQRLVTQQGRQAIIRKMRLACQTIVQGEGAITIQKNVITF